MAEVLGAIEVALDNDDSAEARRLIDHELPDVNAKDEIGFTALHLVSGFDSLELVRLLIERGANIHARDEDDWTPLHHAAYNGKQRVCLLLIKHGADIDAQTNRRSPPLLLALDSYTLPVACLLLEYGANHTDHFRLSDAIDILNNKTQLRHLLPRELVAIAYEYLV